MFQLCFFFFFSSRRRHTTFKCDWSSDVCSSDLEPLEELVRRKHELERESREDVADLAHLAVVAGPDQELHQPAPRRNRATSSVVEYPGTSATRTTRPPQPSTSSAPTISWR